MSGAVGVLVDERFGRLHRYPDRNISCLDAAWAEKGEGEVSHCEVTVQSKHAGNHRRGRAALSQRVVQEQVLSEERR